MNSEPSSSTTPEPGTILPLTVAVFRQGITTGLHLGAQVYISRRGSPLADFALGDSTPGRPLRTDDLMLWFSSGKPLTAIAIAQQYQSGKLSWEDPVTKFIPAFGQNGKGDITVRHLLTHTAGFRAADRLPENQSWEQMISAICRTPLETDWVPGQKAGYQFTSSWFILAEVVSRVDGRPFGQYLLDSVFGPAGMVDCWLGMPEDRYVGYGDRVAPMYLRKREQNGHGTERASLQVHPSWNTAAGCAYTGPGSNARGPTRELGRFYEVLLGDRTSRLLQLEITRTLASRHRIGLYDHTFKHIIDWGLGFIVDSNRYGAETVPYGYGRHCSPETFGHSGSQSSCAFADPTHDLVVAWVCNGLPGERLHQQRAREINSAIYKDLGLA